MQNEKLKEEGREEVFISSDALWRRIKQCSFV
jgi:hypothetical protein